MVIEKIARPDSAVDVARVVAFISQKPSTRGADVKTILVASATAELATTSVFRSETQPSLTRRGDDRVAYRALKTHG
jgi:hypothetical protein